MQAIWRKSIAAKFRDLILKRRYAVNRIASTWRMAVAKRKMKQMKSEESAAKILTQVRKVSLMHGRPLIMHGSRCHDLFIIHNHAE